MQVPLGPSRGARRPARGCSHAGPSALATALTLGSCLDPRRGSAPHNLGHAPAAWSVKTKPSPRAVCVKPADGTVAPVHPCWHTRLHAFLCRSGADKAGSQEPSPRIWLGNITSATTSKALQGVLARFGPLLDAAVFPARIGPLGYAFVKFERLADAVAAFNALNNTVRAWEGPEGAACRGLVLLPAMMMTRRAMPQKGLGGPSVPRAGQWRGCGGE